MKLYKQPKNWKELCVRNGLKAESVIQAVSEILKNVKTNKDQALRDYSLKFDKTEITDFRVSETEIREAANYLPSTLKTAIQTAYTNIYKFHNSQKETSNPIETTTGVTCWRKSVGIDKVGLYIPGGSAPLFSTLLMLGIPAKIAQCKQIILCTPPSDNGKIAPEILYTASIIGLTEIYKVGGAQAIAAMALGTESIPKVDKIFGPGNQYVTQCKQMVQQEGVAIDMPAGPSEVLVIADECSNPDFIAADLLSQAEHGPDSQVILVSTSESKINEVLMAVDAQVKVLGREQIAMEALNNSKAILVDTIEEAFEFSNEYAPEHLILALEEPEKYVDLITNAGSVFLGKWSCESAGDYASGTNHTLPTNGFAKNYSGVSLDSFVKKITFQKLTKEGIQNLGPTIEEMAKAEKLEAHKNAVTIRLQYLNERNRELSKA